MRRPKGSVNKKKFVQQTFSGLTGSDTTEPIIGTPGTVWPVDTTKFIQDEVITTMEITHALRIINQGNFAEVEQAMKEKFFDQGWRLFATHYAGTQPEGVIILYIFIRG